MMIIGIGTDLIEIGRVMKACEKEHFLNRIFTEKERQQIAVQPRLAAGNFAVKEAVAKALGCGFSGFSPADIEVLRNESGGPYAILLGGALKKAEDLGINRWHVTISHTDTLVSATAIGEKS